MSFASIFYFIRWLSVCYFNKRLQNECIAEKNWRSKVELLDVCFHQKMLSGPKDRSFTPPENLPGEGLKHTFIREKWRFSAVGQKRELSSNLPPKRKNRPEDWSAENFENGGAFWGFSELFSPPQNGEFFKSQKGRKFIFSKNSQRAPFKSIQSFFPDPMYPNQNVCHFPDVIR